ncbi:MAG: tellurite resistance/C4-dicarboxylate transporter family protein [Propionibacteriaceae bacterium]
MATPRNPILIMAGPHRGAVVTAVSDAVATLNPGYFAFVMGTGIISVSLNTLGLPTMFQILLVLAAVGWVVLVVLHTWRIIGYPAAVRADLASGQKAFGFFTFVAGTDVLGVGLVLAGHQRFGWWFLVVGTVSWIGLCYLVPWLAALRPARRRGVSDVNGTWFLMVVAIESVAVLAAALEPTATAGQRELAILAVFSWSVGLCLYPVVAALVIARFMTGRIGPADLTPPYWVAMGATAISVLAGARIVEMADVPMVTAIRGLATGASVVIWCFGTWLIPALVLVGWWRHVTHRLPLRYDATVWSIVFPLGMYAVAGDYLATADLLPVVGGIGEVMSWVALAVWVVVLVAMVVHLHQTLLRPRRATGR